MTVLELIQELLKCDQSAKVRITVAGPKDSASSREAVAVVTDLDQVIVRAWVSSDDPEAWMPGE